MARLQEIEVTPEVLARARGGDECAEAPLGAWVRRIAVSKCLMYLRSPWHRARIHLGDESDSLDRLPDWRQAAAAGPEAECFDVARALASLSPTARAVVWLFEVEGYSHEEIAQLFGRSASPNPNSPGRMPVLSNGSIPTWIARHAH